MEQPYIKYVSHLTVDELITLIQNTFKPLLESKISELQESSKAESNLVSAKVVMKKLEVSKPTIYNWLNKGLIKCQKIGGKTLFDLPEILRDIKSNNWKFGRGRNYLYKTTEDPNQETKDDRKYSRINWKVMEKKPLTEEEENFYNNYKKNKK